MNKPASCRCCLSRPPDTSDGIRSLYGVMLKECFNIQLRVGVVSGDADICDVCIKHLQDAYNFRAQVLKCQSEFEAVVKTAFQAPKDEQIDLSDEDAAPDLQFYGAEENSDSGASSRLQSFLEIDLCSNKELTVRPLKPAPDKVKPVPVKIKPLPFKTKPLPPNMKLVLAKMAPVLTKMKPVPVKIKPLPFKTKPLPPNMKLVPAKMKPVPTKMKPVPVNIKPLPVKIKPLPPDMKLVPTKMKPVPTKIKVVPTKMKPAPTRMKPVTTKMKPVSIKMKQFTPSAGGKHEKLGQTEISDIKRLRIDAGLLFKYSNATPFQHKSIAGVDCLFCGETLPTMAALRAHTRDTHENSEVTNKNQRLYLKMDILDLQCKLCHTDFDLISTLQEHLTEQHNIQFRSLKNYILEFKLTDAETMKCARCDSTFETFKMLQQHMGTHYKNYICEVCAAGFINARSMREHLERHETGSYKCSKCDKVFSNKVSLALHEKTHQTKPKMRKCPHCGEMLSSYYARNRHMAQVHNVAAATYKCKVCDREFYLKRDMTWHIRSVHLMERNHICPVCGKAYFSNGKLKDHMSTHGDKSDKHKCAVCHKAYARKYTLREHMRIHNNDRRFQCGVCGLKFVQKCSLKGHMLSTHELVLTDCDNENGVYTCK